MNTFQITEKIAQVYSDVEDELCSKHTVSLNQVTKAFSKTYPGSDPSHYVIVNDTITIVRGPNSQISMALEQGLVLLISPSDETEQLNISSNLCKEVILQNSGKVINSEHEPQLTSIAKTAVQLAVDDLSLNKIKGGFIYVRFLENETVASNKHKLLIALFMASTVINGLTEEYDESELQGKLKSLEEFKNNQEVEDYFWHYSNRSFLVTQGEEKSSLALAPGSKLLFLSLSFFAAEEPIGEQAFCQGYFDQLIQKYEDGSLPLWQMMSLISEAQVKHVKDQEMLQFVQNIVTQFNIKGFLFARGYCIFFVETCRYAEVIAQVSRLIHQALSQQPNQNQPQDLIVAHNSTAFSPRIKQLLFSSVPSTGLSVLDPSKALWF